jgi:hypothetical protein
MIYNKPHRTLSAHKKNSSDFILLGMHRKQAGFAQSTLNFLLKKSGSKRMPTTTSLLGTPSLGSLAIATAASPLDRLLSPRNVSPHMVVKIRWTEPSDQINKKPYGLCVAQPAPQTFNSACIISYQYLILNIVFRREIYTLI